MGIISKLKGIFYDEVEVDEEEVKKVEHITSAPVKKEESKIEDRIEPVASADISDESYNIYTSLLSKTKKIKNDEDK